MTDPVQATRENVRRWLFDAALPLWAERGIDDRGLFHETLDFDGHPDLTVGRRMRVQARQLYVFNQAALMGWTVPAPILERGLESFTARCWAADGEPGWIHLLSPAGEARDLKRDAYDHAFALFALAYVHRNTGDPRALVLADKTLSFMDDRMGHAAGGYHEGLPPVLPRRANPHMHFLESMLAWHEMTGDAAYLERANAVIDLFLRRFHDRTTGTLGEYFEEDWAQAAPPDGHIVEPGHHFEWSWLLMRAADAGGHDARREARVLYDFAIAHGLDESLLAIDECDKTGRQTRRSRRVWPQTELIKAHIAMGNVPAAADVAAKVLDSYLGTRLQGLWVDQYDENGQGVTKVVPASSLYHLMVAFRELLACGEKGARQNRASIPLPRAIPAPSIPATARQAPP